MNETRTGVASRTAQRRRSRALREKAANLGHDRCKASATLRLKYGEVSRMTEQAARDQNPTQHVVQYLRRRGFVVYNSTVVQGCPDRWQVDRRPPMSAEQLFDLAVQWGFKPVAPGFAVTTR